MTQCSNRLPPGRAAPNQTNDRSLREVALVLELWTGRPKNTGQSGPRHRKCERSIRQQIRETLVNIGVTVSGQLVGREFRADETGCLQRNKPTVKKTELEEDYLNRTENVPTRKEKLDRLDFIIIKSLCSLKDSMQIAEASQGREEKTLIFPRKSLYPDIQRNAMNQ